MTERPLYTGTCAWCGVEYRLSAVHVTVVRFKGAGAREWLVSGRCPECDRECYRSRWCSAEHARFLLDEGVDSVTVERSPEFDDFRRRPLGGRGLSHEEIDAVVATQAMWLKDDGLLGRTVDYLAREHGSWS